MEVFKLEVWNFIHYKRGATDFQVYTVTTLYQEAIWIKLLRIIQVYMLMKSHTDW